jgi:hypothetical protein
MKLVCLLNLKFARRQIHYQANFKFGTPVAAAAQASAVI